MNMGRLTQVETPKEETESALATPAVCETKWGLTGQGFLTYIEGTEKSVFSIFPPTEKSPHGDLPRQALGL